MLQHWGIAYTIPVKRFNQIVASMMLQINLENEKNVSFEDMK